MKNGKYIQYSRIFHTLSGGKISRCQLSSIYSELPFLFYAAYSIIISEKLQCLSAAHRDFFRLKKMGIHDTILPPFGETGANPVRARRRNVQSTVIILTRSRVSGKRHWSNSEKAD